MKNINKKNIVIIVSVLILGLFFTIGTFAYWQWMSSDDQKKTVSFSSGDISDYIEYDEGESKFVGDFKVGNSYLDGVHTTISINKTEDADKLDLFATINMDINEIGDTMRNSSAVKWTVTEGNSDNPGTVLGSGNFLNTSSGDTIDLCSDIEVTTEKKEYTIWIWVDIAENPSSELTGEKLDTIVWTQVDQVTSSMFKVTKINSVYQKISATVVNVSYDIMQYQITTSDVEPTSWQDIASSEQGNKYLLEYTAPSSGTYYVWFKDSNGTVVSSSVVVTQTEALTITFNANYLYDISSDDSEYADNYSYWIDSNGTIYTYGQNGSDYAYTNVKVYLEQGQYYTVSGDCGGGSWFNECGIAFRRSDGTEFYMNTDLTFYAEYGGEFNVGFYYMAGMEISYSNMKIYKEETYTKHENGSTIYQEDQVGSLLDYASDNFPGRSGYTLDWYTAESGGSRVTSSTVLTNDVTYYARWIDAVAPSVSLVAQNATTLKLSASDNEGIVGYYFGKTNPGVGGVSYSNIDSNSIQQVANVEYTPVSSMKNWEITVTVTEAGTHYFSVIDAIGNVKTDTIDVYTITYNVNGGSGSIDNQLKLYGGTHTVSNIVPTKTGYTFLGWSTSSTATTGSYTSGDDFTINENKTLYAVYVDNIAPTASFAVSRSDTTISAVFSSVVEQGSGIKEYQYLVQTSSSCPSSGYSSSSSSSYSVTKSAGTYYICARIVDNMGNVSVIYSGSVVIPPSASVYTSAGAYTYTVPVTGNYQLEVWGAQGGGAGGYGGYSTGIVNLTAGTNLYVVVGGQGGKNAGGYNGGGSGQNLAGSATAAGYGGGGATHIAKASGLLQSVSSSNVYIVAGGGGGSGETTSKGAGHGGGYLGNSGTGSCYAATGGSQSSGGAPGDADATSGGYGYGGNAPNGSTAGGTYGAGGGGGGYYGGGGNSFSSGSSCAGGGAGGSGYIGNSSLTYKSMYCYNCATSTSASQITYSTTNVSSSATSYYAKSGDGAAKISYVIGSYSGPQLGVSGSLSSYYQYNAYYESKYGGMYISPHYVEQYYENGNYSIIKIDSIALTSSMYSQSVAWSVNYGVTIDGKQYSCSGTAYTSNYTATNWPCTITSDPIYHNSDGSKTITIALTSAYTVSSQVGASWGTETGTLSSKSVTLTKIPQ